MTGLLFRKAFFDFWDHIGLFFFLNLLGTLLVSFPFVGFNFVLAGGLILSVILLLGTIVVASLVGGLVNQITWTVSQGHKFSIRDIGQLWLQSWRSSLVLGGFLSIVFVGLLVGVPYYSNLGGLWGFVFLVILIWSVSLFYMMLQYYWPISAQVPSRSVEIFPRILMLFLDNFGFTVFLALTSALWVILSVFTVGLFPGFAGVLLWNQTGVKLLLYKYTSIEGIPVKRFGKNMPVPWAELHTEESLRVGKRTLRNMFLPWKP